MTTLAEVTKLALTLSDREREELADILNDSLPPLSEAWRKEIYRRLDDARSGREETIPGDEAMAQILAEAEGEN